MHINAEKAKNDNIKESKSTRVQVYKSTILQEYKRMKATSVACMTIPD